MKTLGNQDESVVVRVTEKEAEILVHEGFHYIPKELWKEKVRDAEQPVPDKPMKAKSNKMSKSAKRHLRKSKK
tara:strand:- start:144 stop:362 length:219 start_codon:yes stop_codon:yes gene_type:complete